jgi:hypothetical protein
MKIRRVHKSLAVLAVAFWLLASAVGVHAHLCQEVQDSSSIHMHMKIDTGHNHQHANGNHQQDDSVCTSEMNVLQSGMIHLLKIDMGLLPLVGLLLLLLAVFRPVLAQSPDRVLYFHRTRLRPLLRAPPAPRY